MLPLKENNPQGVRVGRERNIAAWKNGFEEKELEVGTLPVLGTWTITAIFGYQNKVNSSTTFVVKEYVLPTFRVEIQPPSYITERQNRFNVKVSAKYSFGKHVKGTLRIEMLVVFENGREIKVEDRWLPIRGESVSSVRVGKLVAPKEIPSFPAGQRLKIKAEVTEDATGTKLRAKPVFVHIVKSPYTISFEKSPRFFKPSVSFRVTAVIRYPNKEPAPELRVKFEATDGNRQLHMVKESSNAAKTNNRGEVVFTFDVPPDANQATRITVKVKTDDKELLNTESQMTLEPYISNANNYILVRPPLQKPSINQRISVTFLIPMQAGINQINYLFLSRGKIVKTGVIQKQIGTETTLNVDITADMAPKCRILAFFVRNGEMASDSVLMDVENGYKNEVLLNTDPAPDQTYHPAQDFVVKMKTSTKSVVGLLAVDQSIYYLRNESRVTNEKVFSDIGSFDLGCGLGSGRNNKDVFDRAGLSMLTDAAVPVSKREDLLCGEDPKRRRRRSVAGGISEYCLAFERLKRAASGVCLIRNVVRAFAAKNFEASPVHCQKERNAKSFKNTSPQFVGLTSIHVASGILHVSRGRSAIGPDDEFEVRPDDIDDDVTQLTTREFFPESWIWVKAETNDDGFLEQGFTLPDSITTWEISAIAMNSQTGFGLSNTVNIQSRMNLFIHLKMPPSVQRHEQITVYAVLYNFNARNTRVNLFFIGHASFCSIAKPGERSERLSVVVKGNDAVAIPFTVIPLQVGDSPIEIQAFTVDLGDRIRKNLRVVPEGLQKQETTSIVLDPQGIMDSDDPRGKKIVEVKRDGVQLNSLKVALPDNLVPGSLRVMIYATGNLMAPGVKDMVENGLNNLIVMPSGCGEQTMIYMAPLVYVLKYLYTIKDGVTDEIERKAYNFMRAGYRNELRYRRNDNSYSVWGQKTAPMTWLSAFVNKVFCQASAYIKDDIDSNLICSTFKFLESKQVADGSFAEALHVYHREMRGEVDNKVALTAFVVISLTECSSQCTNTDTKVLSKATSFLEKAVPGIKAGNLMAIVAYALALTGSPGKNNAYSKLVGMLKRDRKDGRSVAYIPDGGLASQVEATSYALLTMIAMNKIKDAGPLVIWLTSMRNARGSFISTQDTVVALQALSEYSSKASTGEMDLRITVASSKIDRKIFRIQKSDALVRQQQDLELTYNVPDEGKDCQYDVTITTREEIDNQLNDDAIPIKPAKPKKNKKNKNKKKKNKGKCKGKKKHSKKCKKGNRNTQGDEVPNRLRISICIRHNFNNGSVMTMAEVGLLSGFKADNESLKNLLDNVKPKVYKYEISDRSVVFYLEKVTTTKSCFGFAMVRAFKVGALQAVPVKVYDYYEPGQICTKFYRPSRNSALLKVICEDEDQCSCSQGSCPRQRSTNPKPLQKTACLHSDYVFTGIVRDIEDQNSMQKIAFRVVDVYKTYSNDQKKDSKMHMYKLTNCDYPEIKSGKQYLIMVKKSEAHVMNEDTYVLEWPDSASKARKTTEEQRANEYENKRCLIGTLWCDQSIAAEPVENMQKDSIDNDTEEEADGLIDEANTSDDSYSEQLTPDREEQLAMQSALERCVAQHNSKHATDQKESSKHFPTIMVPGHGRQYKSTLVRLINEDPHLSKDR
eukprot:gene10956-19791_t